MNSVWLRSRSITPGRNPACAKAASKVAGAIPCASARGRNPATQASNPAFGTGCIAGSGAARPAALRPRPAAAPGEKRQKPEAHHPPRRLHLVPRCSFDAKSRIPQAAVNHAVSPVAHRRGAARSAHPFPLTRSFT